MASDTSKRPPRHLGECRDEDELAEYLHRVYGLDRLPTLDDLRAISEPIDSDNVRQYLREKLGYGD